MTERQIRTVTLRILRDGPNHNHLLSPLTPYLAEVGPYEVVTVRMPYEHRRLLRDLDALRYGATKERGPDVSRIRAPDRRIIADEIGAVFSTVPGLTAEMATEPTCEPTLTHLNLVFAAAELSLLPFELATAPRGFPGEGTPLSVQSAAPVVMTRSIPSATGRKCKWGGVPKILFVAAQPPGFRAVPRQAHLLALLRALEPFIGPQASAKDSDSVEVLRSISKYLTFLPNATFGQIEDACGSTQYTHVHILAHSENIDEAGQSQFALALHGARGGKDLVSADRLQAALRLPMHRRHDDDQLSHPLVVSLATCDSGNQAQVIFPSMSLAHSLHAAGVPLVIGSLFPLSYPGSTVMTETLYRGLLAGRDPRRALHDMRHELYRMSEQTHDWASVVAYASLPDAADLAGQVLAAAFRGAMARLDGWKKLLDEELRPSSEPAQDQGRVARLEQVEQQLQSAQQHIPVTGDYCLEGQGMIASTEKRRAEVLWYAAKACSDVERKTKLLDRSRSRLQAAREMYDKASRAPRWATVRPEEGPTTHWVLTQVLSLNLVLDGKLDPSTWWAARFDAQKYLDAGVAWTAPGSRADDRAVDSQEAMWAFASLAELYLLAHGAATLGSPAKLREDDPQLPAGDLAAKATAALRQHLELARLLRKDSAIKSTQAQLERYRDWWFHDAGESAREPLAKSVMELSTKMLELFR